MLLNNLNYPKLFFLPVLIMLFALLTLSCSLFCDEDNLQDYDQLRDITHWTVDTLDYPGVEDLYIRKLWGSSADDVYAVGRTSEGFIGAVWHYDGNDWTPVPLHIQQGGFIDGWLWGMDIWGFSKDNVYIVGVDFVDTDSSLVIHYNGTEWKELKVGGNGLLSIGGTGPNDIWVGGWHNSDLIHYDGNSWKNLSDKLPIEHPVSISDITKSNIGITYTIADSYPSLYLISTTGTEWKIEDTHTSQDYEFIELSANGTLYSSSFARGPFRKWNNGHWEEFIGDYNITRSLSLYPIGENDLLLSGRYPIGEGSFKLGLFHYNSTNTFEFENLESVLSHEGIYGIWSNGEEIFLTSGVAIKTNPAETSVHKTIIIHGR